MSSDDKAFDPYKTYEDKEIYRISGSALNSIGQAMRALYKRIDQAKEDDMREELEMLRLRDKNPAIKDAWDKYQTVLGLARKDNGI